MSVDLSFWKYKENVIHNHQKIYKLACCDGEIMDELENLPIDKIFTKIATVFSDWTTLNKNNYEKEGRGAFEIFTTAQDD